MQELNYIDIISDSLFITMMNILPIILVFAFFQWGVIRKPIPHWRKKLVGMGMVVLGLAVFIVGLEECIFPLGTSMAQQLSDPAFLTGDSLSLDSLSDGKRIGAEFYIEVILFGFLIGFSTTLAEPASIKITRGLRMTTAFAVGLAGAIGVVRIIKGWPLVIFILAGYSLIVLVTLFAPKEIIGIAYDAGGITTSTITVPLITALGIGLASTIRGRNPIIDGFGLIALASLTPILFVMLYGIFIFGPS